MLPQDSQVKPVQLNSHDLAKLRIDHTRIRQMANDLDTLIYPDSQDSLLLVCGPTGVGKTTLGKYTIEQTLTKCASDMQSDPGFIPAIMVEAPASGERDFSWRLFYSRILQELDQDVELPKVAYGIDSHTGRMIRQRGSALNTLASLRTAVENALRARRTRYMVIDEAAHMIRQCSPSRLEVQLDTLKSLANACGVQMVLLGAYDLYDMMSLSGQLARRSHVLHFARYREDNDSDVRAVRACVQRFQNKLPHLWGDKLMAYADALHENTLGCIGTLNTVLTRAAKLSEQAEGGWGPDTMRRALLTVAQRNRILEEITDGEAAIDPGLCRTMPALTKKNVNQGRRAA